MVRWTAILKHRILLSALTMVLVILPCKPNKSLKHCILVLYDKIQLGSRQHLASPRAVFATRPHPSCCILSYSTRNNALTSTYLMDPNKICNHYTRIIGIITTANKDKLCINNSKIRCQVCNAI